MKKLIIIFILIFKTYIYSTIWAPTYKYYFCEKNQLYKENIIYGDTQNIFKIKIEYIYCLGDDIKEINENDIKKLSEIDIKNIFNLPIEDGLTNSRYHTNYSGYYVEKNILTTENFNKIIKNNKIQIYADVLIEINKLKFLVEKIKIINKNGNLIYDFKFLNNIIKRPLINKYKKYKIGKTVIETIPLTSRKYDYFKYNITHNKFTFIEYGNFYSQKMIIELIKFYEKITEEVNFKTNLFQKISDKELVFTSSKHEPSYGKYTYSIFTKNSMIDYYLAFNKLNSFSIVKSYPDINATQFYPTKLKKILNNEKISTIISNDNKIKTLSLIYVLDEISCFIKFQNNKYFFINPVNKLNSNLNIKVTNDVNSLWDIFYSWEKNVFLNAHRN